MSRAGRIAFGVTAAVSAVGVGVNLVTVVLGLYAHAPDDPHLLGNNTDGLVGVIGRVIDFFSYFTILSNLVVILVCGMLAAGWARPTAVMRALRMDSLMMIAVTGLVFAFVLAPTFHPEGLEYLTNTLEHYVTPILAVLTWLIWGPRGWLRFGTVFTALVLPGLWLVYTFARGTVIHAYPYPFLAVDSLGWGQALANTAGVLVVGIVLGLAFWGLDVLLSGRARSSGGPEQRVTG